MHKLLINSQLLWEHNCLSGENKGSKHKKKFHLSHLMSFFSPAYHHVQNTLCFLIFLKQGQTPVRRITCWSVSLLCVYSLYDSSSYVFRGWWSSVWNTFELASKHLGAQNLFTRHQANQHKEPNSTSKCKELETNIGTHQSTPSLQTMLSASFFFCVPISKAMALGLNCLRFQSWWIFTWLNTQIRIH